MSRCSTAISAPPQAGEEPAGNGRYPALRANHARYDVLGRLSSATATGAGVAWSQSFTHDGFGNLTQRSGSGTPLSVTVNAKNQVTGVSYDANGNQTSIGTHGLTYDAENRLVAVTNVANIGTESYGYSVRGERLLVEHTAPGNSTPFAQELRFYDTNSQLLAVFDVVCAAPCTTANDPYYPVEKTGKKRVYFAGRLVSVGTQAAVTDRLGSLIAHGSTRHRYYPYGEAIGTQEWDKPQFATYTRDGSSGLDDAMNRQYDRIWGRFTSPDPYQASGAPADPGSWNRYAYVQGDPTNLNDPTGLLPFGPGSSMPQPWGIPDAYWWGGGSIVVGGWGTLSRTRHLFNAVSLLEEAAGVDVRPSASGGYDLDFDAEFITYLADSGALSVSATGKIVLGGIAGTVDWASLGAVLGGVLSNPVTITVASAVAVGGLAWYLVQRKADLKEFDEAIRRYERQCGRSLTKGDRRRIHDALGGAGGYSKDEIVDLAKAIFGCPKQEVGN